MDVCAPCRMTGMAKDAPGNDFTDDDITIASRKTVAAGIPAVIKSLKMSNEQMGVRRTARTLARVNQTHGFDCPGCAWPDPADRSRAEFCENGAKAVAEEATLRLVTPQFFREHSVADLATKSGYFLGQQGRLLQPMYKPSDDDHYRSVSWDFAFATIAKHLLALPTPDAATFYTSGRTSNEAAFLYQLLVRRFGTNNLPDCSNMCHESSGAALAHSIGIGKGTVSLEDIYAADLIIVMGQNPGTNHPRMLSALEKAKDNGAHIVSINPLPEAGMGTFKNPQRPVSMAKGTKLADDFLQIRLSGDQALFDDWATVVRALSWDDIETATGLRRDEIERLAKRYRESDRVIVCWAMGLTQHKGAVPTIMEIVNLLLLRGNIGRPGAGVCPVRGHSNVQGDRTMGIWEKAHTDLLDGLRDEFGFEPNRVDGLDTVDTIRAMRDGKVKVFVGMGGNFAAATPDSAATESALRKCDLTVQVSTKLNRSHAVTGREALILPCLGRTERDVADSGEQVVTVEDSMGMVHESRGRLKPASEWLLSEVAIITHLADALFGADDTVDWAAMRSNYDVVREHISRVIPGFENFNARPRKPGGFALPNPPRDRREFKTRTGKARFTPNALDIISVPEGHLLLQTIRSHDQFNTTIYGLDDRYRGIKAGRRVVFVHPDDLERLGFFDGEVVDLVSVYDDGERRAEEFRIV